MLVYDSHERQPVNDWMPAPATPREMAPFFAARDAAWAAQDAAIMAAQDARRAAAVAAVADHEAGRIRLADRDATVAAADAAFYAALRATVRGLAAAERVARGEMEMAAG